MPGRPVLTILARLPNRFQYSANMTCVKDELSATEKADLRKLHVNLGHLDPNVLAEHLKAQKAADHVIAAAREYVCEPVSNGWVENINAQPN